MLHFQPKVSETLFSLSFISALLFWTVASCTNPASTTKMHPKNDTSAVIGLALHTAFERNNLPDIDPLKKPYHYGDSILLTSVVLPLAFLPEAIDQVRFKVLTRQQITEWMQTESDPRKVPNYLNIRAFQKNDSGYYVSLQSLSTVAFGGGGQIEIYIEKQNDTLIVKKTLSSSIN